MYKLKGVLSLFALLVISIATFAQAPVAHFTSDCKILCHGGTTGIGNNEVGFTYDGTGGTPTSYSWIFPSGNPATSTSGNYQIITFDTVGTYLVSVTATNDSGSSSFTDTIFVINNCSANVSVTTGNSVCTGSCINFIDKSNFRPDTWSWTFQNGSGAPVTSFDQDPTNICYNKVGNYNVQLSASRSNSACFNQAIFSSNYITVKNCVPVTSVAINAAPNCANLSVNFSGTPNAGTGNLTYNWSFPGGNPATSTAAEPVVTYSAPGTYNVTLTVKDVNNDSATSTTTINVENCQSLDSLTILPYFGSICTADTFSIQARVKGGKGPIQYSWSFPGGNSSNTDGAYVAGFSYATPGTYTITVIASDTTSHADTATQTIVVYNCAGDTLQISVVDSLVCACSTIQVPYLAKGSFSDTSTFQLWLSYDTSFVQIGSVINSGSRVITATIPCGIPTGTNAQLSLESVAPVIYGNTVNIMVLDSPTSAFTVSKSAVCSGINIKLTYTGGSSGKAHYNWGFNGGTAKPDTGVGPLSIKWASAGTKTVSLAVANGACSSTTTTKTVTVTQSPVATFTISPDSTCINDIVTLTYTGDTANIVSYNWNFDYGTPATGAGIGPQNVSWPSPDTYHPSVTVSANGCTSVPDTQFVFVSLCAGIDNVSPGTSILQVYPNPANDKLMVTGTDLPHSLLTVSDLLGKTLFTHNPTTNGVTIDVSKLTPGVYFLSVKYVNGNSEVRKFVKD